MSLQVVSTYMSDHGDCEKHISGWQEWDGGAQFTVRYKNSLGRVLNGWKVGSYLIFSEIR